MSRDYTDAEMDAVRHGRDHVPTQRLPSDAYDNALSRLKDLPGGAHTKPAIVQAQDFYGNTTQFTVQTVKWDEGETVFVTQLNAHGSDRFVLPPTVTALIGRQKDAVSLMVRRKIGRRLAAERKAAGTLPTFTTEMRAKGLATRKANARKRRKGGG